MCSRAALGSVILVLLVWTISPCVVRAGNDLVFGLSAGGGHVPSDDWTIAATGLSTSRIEASSFSSETLSPFVEASLALVFHKQYAIRLSVEHITTDATTNTSFLIDDPPAAATSLVQWGYSTTPINLTYETYLLSYDRFSPFIGLGGGYYFSTFEWRRVLEIPIVGSMTSEETHDGQGFGMHLYFGFRTTVGQRLGLNSKIRFRYADGTAFTNWQGEPSLGFSGVDVSFGMDVRL